MIWLLDTNIVIALVNGSPGHERVRRRMSGRTPGEVRISAITLSELEFGMANSRDPDANRGALASALAVLQVDDYPALAAEHFGEIKLALRKAGRQPQAYDLLIGAHARAISATLVTSNTDDFRHMPGLRLANWLRS